MSLISKIFRFLYRLAFPGALLLTLSALLVRSGSVDHLPSPGLRLIPVAVFLTGLILSGVFRRSCLFFSILSMGLAQAALAWVVPHLGDSGRTVESVIALMLPLNLLAWALLPERGIISLPGRRRLAALGLEVIFSGALCLPQLAPVAAWIGRPFRPRIVSQIVSKWSGFPQPSLLAFAVAVAVIVFLLIRRPRAVESGLFCALGAALAALREGGGNDRAAVFFAAGGFGLIVALLETSYRMAYHDELTQLPSRRALNEALMKLPGSYTIAMLDVDHFKKFNDNYGHDAGDQALRLVAFRLARIFGGGRAYRYGGEEFAILFPGRVSPDVCEDLDWMRKLIAESRFVVRGKDRRKNRRGKTRVRKEARVTVSIGLASNYGDGPSPHEVLRAADQALLRAKGKGRNCVVTAKGSKGAASVKSRVFNASAG